MIRYRRIVQVISLLFFLFLLAVTIYPLPLLPGLVDIYLRLSPLHLLATFLNTFHFIAAFIPAVVLVVLTLVFGRFFCGWICPMGVTLDVTDRILRPGLKKVDDSREPLRLKAFKYGLLAAVLVAAYFEANLAGWLDPQSFITRTYVQVVLPGFQFAADLVLRGLKPIGFLRPVAEGLHSFFRTSVFALTQPQFHGMVATGLGFLSVALLVYFNRRFWCRFICPMGAILALTSRFSVFKRTVDPEKCIHCNKCARNCRMGAITEGGEKDYRGECIECFTCQDVCPAGAITFRPVRRGAAVLPVNFGRRALIASAGAGLAAVPIVRLAGAVERRGPIRPPGAGGARGRDYFMQTCLRCGQCMRVCPTNAIQPAWFEDGLEGMWSPMIVPIIGYCEYSCTLCGQVCPSGAIEQLTEENKKLTRIGRAVFDKNRCIPWSRSENCLVCEEHCPVPDKAIRFREEKMIDDGGNAVSVKLPYVVEDECIGCGICENKCPVEGPKGVRVTGLLPQERKEEKKAQGAADLLPALLAGWEATGPADTFGQDNLFAFIDGGAETYYEYGFSEAATREYRRGESELAVDVFRMEDHDAAYGIFTYERPAGASDAGVGESSWAGKAAMAFVQDMSYVKLNWYGSGDGRVELEKVARAVSGIAGRGQAPPRILGLLLPGADPASAVIVAGPLSVRGFHPLGGNGEGVFGQDVVGVWYTRGNDKELALMYPGEVEAAAAMDEIKESLTGLSERGLETSVELQGDDPRVLRARIMPGR